MKGIVRYYIIILANVLKRKINQFLEKSNGGSVVDIMFIPDYKKLLKLERKKDDILDLKNLISKSESSLVRRFFFPAVYRSEASIYHELDRIGNKLQKETENPVFSSGHAFVCLDSLMSAYICLNEFREQTLKKISIKVQEVWEQMKNIPLRKQVTTTFGKFQDEDMEVEMMDPDKVNILVDQMVEPFDIIWTNVGGDRGLYVCRRILCNIAVILLLLFLTTPTVYIT